MHWFFYLFLFVIGGELAGLEVGTRRVGPESWIGKEGSGVEGIRKNKSRGQMIPRMLFEESAYRENVGEEGITSD